MNKQQIVNFAKTTGLNAVQGAAAAVAVATVQQLLNGRTVNGKKIVLFTANK